MRRELATAGEREPVERVVGSTPVAVTVTEAVWSTVELTAPLPIVSPPWSLQPMARRKSNPRTHAKANPTDPSPAAQAQASGSAINAPVVCSTLVERHGRARRRETDAGEVTRPHHKPALERHRTHARLA